MSGTGLVLEGGGVRGIYTAGVLDVLMEHGVTFGGVMGVSAGAIHGCSYLSGQQGRSIRYYRKYVQDWRFMSLRSWLLTGNVVGAEFCYHTLPDQLDKYDHEAFLRNPTPFWVVCTDVETGKAAYIRMKDMRSQIDSMRASASLPYFSRIVHVDGHKYLDGGCADSIPVAAMEQMGYQRCVVVLTRDASYRKQPEKTGPARLVYRRYPRFVQALANRHAVYNGQLADVERREKAGSAFVIRPSVPLQIGRLEKDPDKVQQVYSVGRADALAAIDRLKAFLAQEDAKMQELV